MIRRICKSIYLIRILVQWLFKLIFRDGRSDSVSCLVGKTAVVTGGNSGIGYAVSTLLASRGCKVIIADVQNSEESTKQIKEDTGNSNVTWKHLDLSSFSSIRDFAKEVNHEEGKVDILINNAGIGISKTKVTTDNLNKVMQINFFGPFLLTHLLVDSLKATKKARVLFASSIQAFQSNLTLKNLTEELNPLEFNVEDVGKSLELYCNSKLCNIFSAQEFADKLGKYGIRVNSADPGAVFTELFLSGHDFEVWYMKIVRMLRIFRLMLYFIGEDNFGGAQTLFHLASSKNIENVTGQNYFRCRPFVKPSILDDPRFCYELWKKTEAIVKLSQEEKL
ncbi:dehydrogenase/reductase SDR family member 13-like [Harmonia axyridis]|uniref:dehydrogenase/reductase SDR family member 13-like n=1 Tax=Harmonia axyridis TaxID=115357 RepID=UPI001E276436|nr:dehydrogenase/reductase SDR family member 13-like [Harmonia axyridis]